MRFWIREITGWLLVVLGLLVFYLCYLLLRNGDVVETWPLAFIGFVLFRSGIHLLKVAVAAQLWAEAQANRPKGPGAQAPARTWKPAATPQRS